MKKFSFKKNAYVFNVFLGVSIGGVSLGEIGAGLTMEMPRLLLAALLSPPFDSSAEPSMDETGREINVKTGKEK